MSKLIPYLGGKRLLTKTILSLLPEHRLYCEPFGGSGTILLEKEPSGVEVINDIDGEIVNLFRIVQTHQEEFLRCIRWNLRSREEFLRLKNSLPAALTDIQRAARLYLYKTLRWPLSNEGRLQWHRQVFQRQDLSSALLHLPH